MKWKSARLAEISDLITKGTTPTTLGYTFSESGIPFLRVQNIRDGTAIFETDTLFVSAATHQALNRSQILPGDILVSIAGTIGRAGIVPEHAPSMNCNQAVAVIRTSDSTSRRFLRFWLESKDAQAAMTSSSVTGTIANLSLTQLRDLKIPLPPLAEQKRIAGILDAADALRAKRRESLAQLDSLLQSTFLTLFGDPVSNPMGWEVVTVGNEVSFLTSGSRGWAQYYAESGDLFIRIQNLRGGTLDLSDAAYVSAPESAEARRTKVEPGDVLLSITADLGRTAVVPDGISKAHINQHLAILRFHTMNPTFVSHQIATAGCQTQFVTLNRAAVKAGLNFNDVRSIRLLTPPLPLQRRFAAIVESVERQKARQRAHLAELDALFASLQHRAFRGEL